MKVWPNSAETLYMFSVSLFLYGVCEYRRECSEDLSERCSSTVHPSPKMHYDMWSLVIRIFRMEISYTL